MKSKTHPAFWKEYNALPQEIQKAALSSYKLFRENPFHSSLQFKLLRGKKGMYSVRIGQGYRALGGITGSDEITWFWIGTHYEYDTLIK